MSQQPNGSTVKHSASRGRRVLVRIALVVLAVVLVVGIGFGVYVSDYYHATSDALAALDDGGSANAGANAGASDAVRVTELPGEGMAFEAEGATTGIIFYPGGKVQADAYAPLCRAIAERGITCVLQPMPFNLAVFGIDAADGVQALFPGIDAWFMAGHSLGGSMAAQYASAHANSLDGLVLLGSYSAADLSASGLRVLSLYGSADGVLDRQKYQSSWANLPANATELVIEGGNHAQFGDYGKQQGDGEASISADEQRTQAADAMASFVLEG